jgi:hypothetical protein
MKLFLFFFSEHHGSGKQAKQTNANRKKKNRRTSETNAAAAVSGDQKARTSSGRKTTKTNHKTETSHGATAVLEKIIPPGLSPVKTSKPKIKQTSSPIEQSYLTEVVKAVVKEELQRYMMTPLKK